MGHAKDATDRYLHQQRQETKDQSLAQRVEVAQTGEQQRAQLTAFYAQQRQQQRNEQA